MDVWLLYACVLLPLSLTGELEGVLKSSTTASPGKGRIKEHFCKTCKVKRKVGNHTVSHDKRAVLKCAFGGISPKNITWLKDGKKVNANDRITKSVWAMKRGSKLRIKRVSSKDSGQYSCVGHNAAGLMIISTGYLTVTRRGKEYPRLRVPPVLIPKPLPPVVNTRPGKCEQYRGKICSPYIGQNTLIFVDVQKRQNNQEFIETKLSIGYGAMKKMLNDSCKPYALPLWCHYHFPECTLVNSKAEPKMICKNECEQIKKKHCRIEYAMATKRQSRSSEDDLFPDCNVLPQDTRNGKCVSLNRHDLPDLLPGPGSDSKRGRCVLYSGKVCGKKIGKKVFVPEDTNQHDIEKEIKRTRQNMGGLLSKQCQPYFLPLLCQLKLPDCDESLSPPKGKPICKDECLVLKKKYCRKEYATAHKSRGSSLVFDCSSVQDLSRSKGKCSKIDVLEKDFEKGDKGPEPVMPIRVGICSPYKGEICKKFLDTKRNIFVDANNLQANIEKKLKRAIDAIENYPKLSSKCRPFVLPLMCHHLFPYCKPSSESTQPKPSYICRNDCLHIQHNFCPVEYEIAEQEHLTGSILFPRCLSLSVSSKGCISFREGFFQNKTDPIPGDCYVGEGGDYRGYANTTESGLACQRWDADTPHRHRFSGDEYPELIDGHNFCRNPGGKRNKPWCFTMDPRQPFGNCKIRQCANAPINGTGEDYMGTVNKTFSGKTCDHWNKHEPKLNWAHNYCRNPRGSNRRGPWCYTGQDSWELCDIPDMSATSNPEETDHLSNLLYTVIPCVVFGLFVGVVIIAVCWKQHKQGLDFIKKDSRVTVTVFFPELKTIPSENILLSKFIGNGRFGTLYAGEIHSPDCNRVPASRLIKVAMNEAREEFMNQAKVWSQFHHAHILAIDAISSGDDPVTLVFEHVAHGSLYQYLIHHSPNNPNFTSGHALLTTTNLLDIAGQVAAGMTYLSSHDYVHGDLMTRNCQVTHSIVIKITDFSVDRDACYYRRPNKRPLAVGWMAPEAIQTEIFTVHSDVWAFGVLLWELFTYGFQPYFGYTYAEVKKKISDMVLLERPRDCMPRVYGLMRKCWSKNPALRPQFFDLHEDLCTLSAELLHGVDDDSDSYAGPSSC